MRTPGFFFCDGKFDKTRRNNEIFDDTVFNAHYRDVRTASARVCTQVYVKG